jgi:hypothetical protein
MLIASENEFRVAWYVFVGHGSCLLGEVDSGLDGAIVQCNLV